MTDNICMVNNSEPLIFKPALSSLRSSDSIKLLLTHVLCFPKTNLDHVTFSPSSLPGFSIYPSQTDSWL